MNVSKVTLSDVAAMKGLVGGPFGSSLVSNDYQPTGVPVIRGTNLGHGKFLGGEYAFVSEEKVARDLSRNLAKGGDVVFTQRGTLGQVALVPGTSFERYVISQSQMRLRVDPTVAAPDFVYYACSSALFEKQIADNAISTGVPHINLGILGRLTISLPSMHEQRAIAEVLGALDDKIAANTKLASTADEWVRAGFDALSVESFEMKSIGELVSLRRDQAGPASFTGDILYVGLEHLPRRSMWLAEVASAASVTSQKSRFEPGDILFGKLRPYFHKVVTAPHQGVCSTDILVLKPSESELSGFTLAAVASDAVVREVTSASEGTRMPRTSWKDLAAVEVPWPGPARARRFDAEVVTVRAAVESQLSEIRSLAATRDALLPPLMSGKLRVKDAEKVLEGVL
jgi:type I restriction enzyme S subunit